ncbi:hypothetical protein ALC57_00480, partial [Trachymyrmex cornetzi]
EKDRITLLMMRGWGDQRVAQEHEIGHASVSKILKLNKWHPYKLHLCQELSEDDFDRRIEFCDLMMEMIFDDPLLLNNIVFSDEITFELTGNVNRHNCRYWSDVNPHWKRDNHTQYPQKVNVWAGILDGRPVGPFFIEGNIPIFYRYVDDIILIVPTNYINDILHVFNSYHDRLNFTCEQNDDGSINFLDVSLKVENGHILNASYVGQTKRKVVTRISEHKANALKSSNLHTVVAEHQVQFDHNFDWDNVKVLDIEPFFHKRLTSEMIFIKKQ